MSHLNNSDLSSLLDLVADPLAQPDWASPTPGVEATAAKTTAPVSVPQTMALYLTEPGDTAAISMNDVHQGQIGDCFLLSPIGDLANVAPSVIQNMIHANANGTETVTLHLAANGTFAYPGATSFKTISEIVTNVFPSYGVNNGATQDVVGSQKEIWVQVLEKAVAQAGGGYGSIANGGNPAMAMEELTGQTANFFAPTSVTAAMLQTDASAGDLMTFDTKNSSSLSYNLVGNHAYMFKGVVNTASGAAVSLANPWGIDQPSLIPVSQLSKVFVEVDVGKA